MSVFNIKYYIEYFREQLALLEAQEEFEECQDLLDTIQFLEQLIEGMFDWEIVGQLYFVEYADDSKQFSICSFEVDGEEIFKTTLPSETVERIMKDQREGK